MEYFVIDYLNIKSYSCYNIWRILQWLCAYVKTKLYGYEISFFSHIQKLNLKVDEQNWHFEDFEQVKKVNHMLICFINYLKIYKK